jgi:hypothetical protein
MDQGNGIFKQLEEFEMRKLVDTNPQLKKKIFSVGEHVEIKDSRFKIIGIGKREMRLKLIPDNPHELINK